MPLLAALFACTSPTPVLQEDDPVTPWRWARPITGPSDEDEIDAVAADALGNVFVSGKFEQTLDVGGDFAPLVSAGAADIMVLAYDADGALYRADRIGGTGEDNVFDADTDAEGNLILSGWFGDQVDFGGETLTATGQDGVVWKVSPTGELLWITHFAGPGDEGGNEVSVAPDGRVVVGVDASEGVTVHGETWQTTAQQAHVFVLDGDDGTVEWAGGAYTTRSRAKSIAVGADGSIWFGGDFRGHGVVGDGADAVPLEAVGGPDAFLSRWSRDGELLWATSWGGEGDDLCKGVAALADGSVYAAGFFEGTVDWQGHTLRAERNHDQFVARLDEEGAVLWVNELHTRADLGGSEVIADQDDVLWFGGTLSAAFELTHTAGAPVEIEVPGGTGWPLLLAYDRDGALVHHSLPPLSDAAGAGELALSGRRLYLDIPMRGGPFDFGDGPFQVGTSKDAAIAAIDLP